jgi:hypothetical protein
VLNARQDEAMSEGHIREIARAALAYTQARDTFEQAARRHTASGAEWRAMIAAETRMLAAAHRAMTRAAHTGTGLDTSPHMAPTVA